MTQTTYRHREFKRHLGEHAASAVYSCFHSYSHMGWQLANCLKLLHLLLNQQRVPYAILSLFIEKCLPMTFLLISACVQLRLMYYYQLLTC